MKYVVIQQHQERFQAHRMCQVFHVFRSGDYEWCRRSESRRSQADRRLGEKIKAIYKKSRWTYGARRIQTEPCEELILN